MNPKHVADSIASGQYAKTDERAELTRSIDAGWYGSSEWVTVPGVTVARLVHEITERRAEGSAYQRLDAADQALLEETKADHFRRKIPSRMSHSGQGFVCGSDLDSWPCAAAKLIALIDRNLDTSKAQQ